MTVDYEGQKYYYLGDSTGANIATTVANQVVDYVANNLQFNSQNAANQKWSDDLQWVRSYRIDNQRHFLIENIKQFR